MASFQPDPAALNQLVSLLQASGSQSGDNAAHRQAQQQLEEYSAQPQFALYLAYVMVELQEAANSPLSVRAIAGLLLKNVLRRGGAALTGEAGVATQRYVQEHILRVLGDPIKLPVRSLVPLQAARKRRPWA